MITRNQARFIAAASPGIGSDFPTMMQLATFTIWLVFAAVGIVGVIWRSNPDHADSPAAVKELTIDVSTASLAAPASADLAQPPPSPPPDPEPAMPPAQPAVAAPAPDIALAIPMPIVAKPAAPVAAPPVAPSPAHVAPVASNTPPAPAAPAHSVAAAAPPGPASVHHLALGQGEGQYIKQNLEYPDEAHLAGEEGIVAIQFTQDADGHVTEAHIIKPSQWPILNQAALRAVRKTIFPPGDPSQNDVPIGFKLE